jgi:hypothetical protein
MARPPRIYLDACALNRITDPPLHARIALETAAVERLLLAIRAGRIQWIASSILAAELGKNPNSQRRAVSIALLGLAYEMQPQTAKIADLGKQFRGLGLGDFDALHLAAAQEARCDVLLTTDDKFQKWANRNLGGATVGVQNPLDYLKAAPL